MRKQTPEGAVLSAVCEYLLYKHYSFWRMNNGGVFNPTRGAFMPAPKYGMKGVSDLIMLYNGRAIFLEIKSPVGKQSPDQKNFQTYVEHAKCKYFVIRSIDDLTKYGI